MKEVAHQIHSILDTAELKLSRINEEETKVKSSSNKWSKKEILGHLIDSAANNHQRIVRAAYHVASQFPPYDQNEWVRIQHYQEAPWSSLVALWSAYNSHLCHVIECIPVEAEQSPCNIGKEKPVPLDFVVKDYLRHLQHHLQRILNE